MVVKKTSTARKPATKKPASRAKRKSAVKKAIPPTPPKREAIVNKGGRPQKAIDYAVLETLVRIQCTGEECAAVLKMDYDTLNRKLQEAGEGGFTDYFKRFASHGRASLRRMQWKKAEQGHTTMLIWLGKQMLGQKDNLDLNVADTTPPSVIDWTKVSPATKRELLLAYREPQHESAKTTKH